MTRKLTIELPDELEQRLLAEARRLNTSLEKVVVQSLARSLIDPSKTGSKTFMLEAILAPSDLPLSEESVVDTLLIQKEHEIAEIMQHIREAKTARTLTINIPASAIALHLAGVLKNSGLIADFQLRDRKTHPYIKIHLNPNNLSEISTANPLSSNSNDEDFPEEMVSILQDLENEDPAVRVKAVAALGELYRESN